MLSPPRSEATPVTVQSALGAVRPDDMDAIFDDALFGAPAAEATPVEAASESVAPVAVGSVEWFLERDAQPTGPLRLERLRELWHHGALGPDTLCWCEAWSQWRPLSSVPELVAALTDAGLPTVAADAAPAPARQDESKAKVASALPALVAEEEEWLRKVQEEKEQAQEEARSAMLDTSSAPAPEPVLPPHFAPLPVPVPVAPPVVAPVPVPPMGPPVVAPAVIPALVMPEAPVAPEPSRRGKGLVVGAVVGATAVGLAMGALLLLPQLRSSSERVPEAVARPVVAAASEPPRQVAPVPVVAPPPAPAPQPAPAAAPVQPAPAAAPVQPAPPKPQPPAAPVAPVVEKQEAKVVAPPARVPAPATPEPPRKVAAVAAPVVREKPRQVEAERIARVVEPAPRPAPVSRPKVGQAVADDASAADPTNFDDSLDKEFERQLFSGSKPEDPRSKRTVYLPPEPGKDLPESLSTSDVMQVVGSHKDGIVSCLEAHQPPRDPDTDKGRFVLRWRVQPSGTATDVLMETEALKGTPFARCMEAQVRSWKFPRHRVRSREPVRFPFTY